MSGHNKWSKIKNVKEKNDQQNAKMYTKIGREIAVAVKLGGPDPNSNSQLKNIIAKAKAINMPNDNINRSIKKASGELNTVNYESMTYEGYGIGGSAVIVYALTDNKNRTASDVRHSEALWPRCKGGGLSAESLKAIQPERPWLAPIITADR